MTDANATLRLDVTGGSKVADEVGRVERALNAVAPAATRASQSSKVLTQTGLNPSCGLCRWMDPACRFPLTAAKCWGSPAP